MPESKACLCVDVGVRVAGAGLISLLLDICNWLTLMNNTQYNIVSKLL